MGEEGEGVGRAADRSGGNVIYSVYRVQDL